MKSLMSQKNNKDGSVMIKFLAVILILGISLSTTHAEEAGNDHTAVDAGKIVKGAFEYWRGKASVSLVDMRIHRPGWERTMTIKGWTLGESDSLFVIKKPVKDKGNGTLKQGNSMWIFNPKVSKVIKLPPSMMSQAWQGSDFSNNDLAKTDSLIKDYVHTIESFKVVDGIKIYKIKSMPKSDAPVIWGMIKLEIREDNILLSEVFYDEDMEPVKGMKASNLKMTNNRLFPMNWIMKKSDVDDEYTELSYREIEFKKTLSKRIFTRSNLKNPGR